uniref:Uncharacterized protein n=1 Tax=Helianthus annuus TaxID=4232 RepID=A0A251SZ20_HELAN
MKDEKKKIFTYFSLLSYLITYFPKPKKHLHISLFFRKYPITLLIIHCIIKRHNQTLHNTNFSSSSGRRQILLPLNLSVCSILPGTSEMEQIFGDNKVMEEGLVKLILQLHFVDPDEDLVN